MKHLVTCILWGITFVVAYAQPNERIIGKKVDGGDLTAVYYSFPQRLQSFSTDKSMRYICLHFRDTTSNGKSLKNKGEVGIYDIKRREIMWKDPINYLSTLPVFTSEGVLLHEMTKTSLLDFQTGNERWKSSFFHVYVSDSLNVLLGYKYPASDILRAIRLSDGTELWRRKLSHRYGWQQQYDIYPDKRLIVADDIHELNLLTGEMFTHEAKTGVEDVKGMLLKGVGALALGIATGMVSGGLGYVTYVPTYSNVIIGMVSNVLLEDSCYYVADRRCITCLDRQLGTRWRTDLPDKRSSYSRLFMMGDKLYMLNYGYALKDGSKKVKNGRPFIACYDKHSGEEIYFNQLTTQKDMIEDAYISEDEALYMLFDDGLAYQYLNDSIVDISLWDTEKYGRLHALVKNGVYRYRRDKEDFIHLESSADYCMVSNDKMDIFEVDKKLNVRTRYGAESIYDTYYALDAYRLIGNGQDFWLIHELGMPVAHLTTNFRYGYAQGRKLWLLSNENEILEVDLDKALE